jgi:hypothetical protein
MLHCYCLLQAEEDEQLVKVEAGIKAESPPAKKRAYVKRAEGKKGTAVPWSDGKPILFERETSVAKICGLVAHSGGDCGMERSIRHHQEGTCSRTRQDTRGPSFE